MRGTIGRWCVAVLIAAWFVAPVFAQEFDEQAVYLDFARQQFLERILTSPLEERFYIGDTKVPGWYYAAHHRYVTGDVFVGDSRATYLNRGIVLSGIGPETARFTASVQRWDLPTAEGNYDVFLTTERVAGVFLHHFAVNPWFFEAEPGTSFAWNAEALLYQSLRVAGAFAQPRFPTDDSAYELSVDVVDAGRLPGIRNSPWADRLAGFGLKNLVAVRSGKPEWFSQTFFVAGLPVLDGITWDYYAPDEAHYLSAQTSVAFGPIYSTQRLYAATLPDHGWTIWRYALSVDPYMVLVWLWTRPMGADAREGMRNVSRVNANMVDGNHGAAVYYNAGFRYTRDFYDPQTGTANDHAYVDGYYEAGMSAPGFFPGSKLRLSVIYRTIPQLVEDARVRDIFPSDRYSRLEFNLHFGYLYAGIIRANRNN